jgi:hypothetical protein
MLDVHPPELNAGPSVFWLSFPIPLPSANPPYQPGASQINHPERIETPYS